MDSFTSLRKLTGSSETLPHNDDYLDEMKHAKQASLDILNSIIGDQTRKNVELFDITDSKKLDRYVDLINDPSVDISAEDTQHGVKEFKGEGEYTKEPYYLKIVSYTKIDYANIFKKMKDYLEKMAKIKPPISDPSGMRVLLEAWEYLYSGVPLKYKSDFFEVVQIMKKFTEEIQERSDKQSEEVDKNISDTIKRLEGRDIVRDKIDTGLTSVDDIPEEKDKVEESDKGNSIEGESPTPASDKFEGDSDAVFDSILENASDEALYDKAYALVLNENKCTYALLQRELNIGHTKASEIVKELEKCGVVGPLEGSKPRKILVEAPTEKVTKKSGKQDG